MSTPSQPAGRMSQMLPSVKCSNCGLQIPITELGDHICAPAPPLPTPNAPKTSLNLPKPSFTPNAATSLLPQRLQGLVNGPGVPSSTGRASPGNPGPSRNDPPRLNTGGPSLSAPSSSYPTRPSPLSGGPSAPRSSSRDPYASGGESPVRSRPPVGNFGRARSGSNASAGMSPTTARPSYAREVPPPAAGAPQPPPLVTQVGGEAGMAGVGRRGFAAAARAAMFAHSSPSPTPPSAKASPPRNIDIGATIRSDSTPPPLSTSSGSSHSPGIASYPESPVSPRSPPSRAPITQLKQSTSLSSRGSSIKKGTDSLYQTSESDYGGLAYADSAATDYEDDDDDDAADLRRVNELRSPLEPFRRGPPSPPPVKKIEISTKSTPRANAPKRRDSESEESDYGETPVLKRTDSARVAQAFGLSQTPKSSYDRLGGPGLNPSSRSGHSRGSSGESGQSSRSLAASGEAGLRLGASRKDAELPKSKSMARERSFSPEARKKDLDDSASLRSRRSDRSLESRTTGKPAQTRQSPARERSATRERERAPRKPKVCVRCEKKIDDGKWVSVDGGGVLCERCWKNMYLPKCRRCNLPIEKQAVSSSDGQLKGKYHRECFNCFTCQKPFPDKTFYVLDGKPLCAYHYHEANDSLCAAARCGQPIEGPCAVSHAGDRYHPEHMLCEFPGSGGCKERLDEYWEVDGRMLCERHSRASRLAEEEADEDAASIRSGPKRKNTRAMKRVTRYIDLANPGGR
ncbi:hypothetical protein B0H12DRAFT_1228790 [Mycena haematopus]|nr:hypothetical protein B0H12DRAFT_1228790 [Mycena haematopus]